MRTHFKINREGGFTLVEVMVIGSLVAMLMLGFSIFMFQQSRKSRSQEIQQNVEQQKQRVVDAASQPETLIRSEQLSFED